MPKQITQTSELPAAPDAVWDRIASMDGINHELGPWMRMTSPRGAELSVDQVPLGRRWFRSWVLLGGVIPFDYDDLRIERLEPGRGFLERSSRWPAAARASPTASPSSRGWRRSAGCTGR